MNYRKWLVPTCVGGLILGVVVLSARSHSRGYLDVDAVRASPQTYWNAIASAVSITTPALLLVAAADPVLSPRDGATLLDLIPASSHKQVVLLDDRGVHLMSARLPRLASTSYITSLAVFPGDVRVPVSAFLSERKLLLLLRLVSSSKTVDQLRSEALGALGLTLASPGGDVSVQCHGGLRRRVLFKSICTTCPSYARLQEEFATGPGSDASRCQAVAYLPKSYIDALGGEIPAGVIIEFYDGTDPAIDEALSILELTGERFPVTWES